MFNNLIESTSHRSEMKRRGSFLFFTTGIYALLFVVAGVASIYAYEARLDQQQTELTILTFTPPPETPTVEPVSVPNHPGSSSNSSNITRAVRPVLIDSVNNPVNSPLEIGTTAQSVPHAPPGAIKGPYVADPGGGRPGSSGIGNSSTPNMTNLVDETGPPPVIKPAPPKVVRASEVLNGKAIQLPKPPYPEIARTAGTQGMVKVQILIDEQGKVISAQSVYGPMLLRLAAQRAAYQAVFSPTLIGDQPVKVSGLITYNFVLNR